MKQLLFILTSAFFVASVSAQETYENANIASEDLNGTARFVGMGGAMDALGADISTIGTNPAGIGLFRHSTANVSFSVVSQQGGKSFADGNKTHMSFDQAGFVYSKRTGRSSFLNFAFNYHKSRDFNYILSAADVLKGASQNKLSGLKNYDGYFLVNKDQSGSWTGDHNSFNQVDELYFNALLSDGNSYLLDRDGNPLSYGGYGYLVGKDGAGNYMPRFYDASGYMFDRANTGYIGEYDFNISGNINDRVYLGLTVGISDVNYKGYSEYTEMLVGSDGAGVGGVTLADERRISGTGVNVKAGVIIRPIETSPFRIGLSVATPTWYDLTTSNYTYLNGNLKDGVGVPEGFGSINSSYDFKLYTPWKFGVSLGTTVGNFLAIGAGYEYADYGNIDSRVNTGGGYDWFYDEYWETSESDREMNRHTENTLKGVSTLRLGLELKPDSKLSVRLGYNYVSPMYDKYGFKDGTIDSPGSYFSSSTDYTNWKATNRLTCGLGYNIGKLSLDVAYQYSVQSGDFSPFTSYYVNEGDSPLYDNICNSVKVDNKRHQVLMTVGYHF